jgi:hypothetical protein
VPDMYTYILRELCELRILHPFKSPSRVESPDLRVDISISIGIGIGIKGAQGARATEPAVGLTLRPSPGFRAKLRERSSMWMVCAA